MAGLTDYTAQNALNWITGEAAMPATTERYIALFTAVGTDGGTGFTEVSGGSYARAAAPASSWNAASGSDPSTASNSAAIAFPTSTASWGDVIAFGVYDAATGGNLLDWDWIGNDKWFPFTCTSASPGVLTAIGITAGSTPTLADGALVVVDAEWGGTLPTGLAVDTQYTVAGLSADTFNVGVNTTTTGSGMVRQVTPQTIPNNTTFSFAAGALTLTLT